MSVESPDRSRTTGPVGKPSHDDAAGAIAAVLGMLLAGAAWLLARRRVRLRKPTRAQMAAMSNPAARLALRHADLSSVNADTVDLLSLGAAVGAYVTDGPLTSPAVDDAGMPDNLQETDT